MYLPKSFRESDDHRLARLIADYPFGTLISQVEGRPFASHVPFLHEDGVLWCHLAKANPQAGSLQRGGEVLCIFQGPHAYISPSWYETADVPTWNFTAVHIYGKAQPIASHEALGALVDRLSARFEADFPEPWTPTYPPRLLDAIVGFKIEVTQMQGKFKLSQNRCEADRANVIRALAAMDDPLSQAMANMMREVDKTSDE